MMYNMKIREEIATQGRIGIDPRHVEGFMRVMHPTLDGLSEKMFKNEVSVCIDCSLADPHLAERNAKSFGL